MTSNPVITVFGAYGHTGRFVVAETRKRGWSPVLSGGDAAKLEAVAAMHGGLDVRPASLDSQVSLDRALGGSNAVINCAGPFAATAEPLIDAALRAHIPYLDVTAEVEVCADEFEKYADRAREAGIVIMPAMGFYEALGDLLATAAMGDWSAVDEICVAYALSSWKPTPGTRSTIRSTARRRGGRRLVFSNNRLELRSDPAPIVDWTFPPPIGTQTVEAEFTTPECVMIPRHLTTTEIRTYMTLAPLADLSDPDLSPPFGIDESGRSSQTFLVEAVARLGRAERRAVVRGRDIYAVTAPIVVEATQRILDGLVDRAGVVAAGAVFDSRDFLESLSPEHLSVESQ
jgi:Saccharopine dehydrogenase NADP binding domain